MKTIKRIQQYVDVVDDIICNKCAESCRTGDNDDGSFDGLIEVEACGSYWSKTIGDMNRYKFSLCEKCLVEFAKTFKIDSFEERE
jgi:hypothetical protein